MSAPRSPNPISSGGSTPPNTIDPSPLLSPAPPRNGGGGGGDDSLNRFRSPGRRPSIRDAAQFFRRAGGRRLMREPSMAVRETAAEQLEERQTDWAYSRPIVILDILWNLAFVTIAGGVLVTSRDEKPVMPLRLWILGYAAQCGAHMICVCIEYRRRRRLMMQRRRRSEPQSEREEGGVRSGPPPSSPLPMPPLRDLEEGSGSYTDGDQNQEEEGSSVTKHLESANTMFSFVWWMVGFYWVSAGGPALTRDSPQLYWLCIVFLAFDVFFVVFCVALACVVGIAVCCCLPCIIAILYAVADQEGASDEDIRQLPKYKFRRTGGYEELGGEISKPSGGIMTQCGSDPPHEHVLSAEDAECCICLSAYDDGAELRELPCGHHFHCACIDKWLHINATCPLCKYNIIKSNNHGTEEV